MLASWESEFSFSDSRTRMLHGTYKNLDSFSCRAIQAHVTSHVLRKENSMCPENVIAHALVTPIKLTKSVPLLKRLNLYMHIFGWIN